jgi:hypothetical protein
MREQRRVRQWRVGCWVAPSSRALSPASDSSEIERAAVERPYGGGLSWIVGLPNDGEYRRSATRQQQPGGLLLDPWCLQRRWIRRWLPQCGIWHGRFLSQLTDDHYPSCGNAAVAMSPSLPGAWQSYIQWWQGRWVSSPMLRVRVSKIQLIILSIWTESNPFHLFLNTMGNWWNMNPNLANL